MAFNTFTMLYNYYTFYFQNISSPHKESLHSLRESFQSSTKFFLAHLPTLFRLPISLPSPTTPPRKTTLQSWSHPPLPTSCPLQPREVPHPSNLVFLRSSLNLTPVAPNRQCLSSLVEKAMAPHSSTLLAWRIPWTEKPGGLQSTGSRRVAHDWATSLSLFTFMHWRRTWQPTPAFLPGESQGWGSLVGCRLWGRTESDTTEVTLQQ